jgi:hypothetical protein
MNKTPQHEINIVPIANTAAISPIYRGVTVAQSFSSNLSRLSKVSLYVATYLKKDIPGNGTFEILDQNRKVMITQSFKLSDLIDNSYHDFNFKALHLKPDQKYYLTLTSDVKQPAPIFTLWSNQGFNRSSFALIENGQSLKGSIIFKIYGN